MVGCLLTCCAPRQPNRGGYQQTASVSGSKLAFLSPTEKPVNLILSDGTKVTGSTVRGALNIEIFTAGPGTALPGVDATATIGGAVKLSSSEVQAGMPGSPEQLGIGDFKLIDETGHEKITLGTGEQTVVGSTGDTIVGGNAGKKEGQVIDLTGTDSKATAGPMTAIGGAGALFVEAGSHDSISGGSGPTTVSGNGSSGDVKPPDDRGNGDDSNGNGDHGHHHTVPGAVASNDSITGGSGPMTVIGGTSDSIKGGTGSLFVEDVTNSTVSAGTGGTTVVGGNNDVINDSVSGSLLVDIESRSSKKRDGDSPSVAGSGAETVNLGASHGMTTLNDISVPGGSGPRAATTVTGFSTALDVIESKTSVNPHGHFLGTSSVAGGNTVLNFVDGSTMTLVGITDITKVHFTR